MNFGCLLPLGLLIISLKVSPYISTKNTMASLTSNGIHNNPPGQLLER